MESPHGCGFLVGTVAVWKGAHVGADFLMGTVACGEPVLGQSVSEELHPWKGLMLEQRTVAYGRAPTLEQGMSVRKEPDMKHFELTTPTHSPSTCTAWGWRGGGRIKSKVGPGKKGI